MLQWACRMCTRRCGAIRTSSPGGMRQRATIATALLIATPQVADRRRADDSAGCYRPGADLDTSPAAEPGAWRRDPADQPRPWRAQRDLHNDRRDVCGAHRADRSNARIAGAPQPSLHARSGGIDASGRWRARRQAEGDRRRAALAGRPARGCKFHPRCAFAIARCGAEEPARVDVGDTRSACWVAQASGLPVFAPDLTTANARPQSAAPREVLLAATDPKHYFRECRARRAVLRGIATSTPSTAFRCRSIVAETLGIVGEIRAVVQVHSGAPPAAAGSMSRPAASNSRAATSRTSAVMRCDASASTCSRIFQDPYASLNPRLPVADIVAEPWR